MDATTMTSGSIVVDSGVSGTVFYGGGTLTFTPSQALRYSTTYTVTINAAVKDAAGNPMGADVEFTFDASSSRMVNGVKFQTHCTGRATCTVDLSRNFISASAHEVETTNVNDVPMPDGTRFTSTSHIASQQTQSIRPL